VKRGFLRRWLPSPEQVRDKPGLRWLRPLLERPWLWHINRQGVATGAAIGVFFGFCIPIAQIPFSALTALLLRANLPAAELSTLVSNPLTYAPIYVLAYRAGSAILGETVDEAQAAALGSGAEQAGPVLDTWLREVAEIGKPLVTGLASFAVCGALFAYFGVQLGWRAATALRAARRRRRARTQARNSR
jgi:uncharacterized protein (DUF2062 family)